MSTETVSLTSTIALAVGAESSPINLTEIMSSDVAGHEKLVDSLSSPPNQTAFDVEGDCHIKFTFTYEETNSIEEYFRLGDGTAFVLVEVMPGLTSLALSNHRGSLVQLQGVFIDGIAYQIDIRAVGQSVKVWVDKVIKIDYTERNVDPTRTGGRSDNTLDTNDIELSSSSYLAYLAPLSSDLTVTKSLESAMDLSEA